MQLKQIIKFKRKKLWQLKKEVWSGYVNKITQEFIFSLKSGES